MSNKGEQNPIQFIRQEATAPQIDIYRHVNLKTFRFSLNVKNIYVLMTVFLLCYLIQTFFSIIHQTKLFTTFLNIFYCTTCINRTLILYLTNEQNIDIQAMQASINSNNHKKLASKYKTNSAMDIQCNTHATKSIIIISLLSHG